MEAKREEGWDHRTFIKTATMSKKMYQMKAAFGGEVSWGGEAPKTKRFALSRPFFVVIALQLYIPGLNKLCPNIP